MSDEIHGLLDTNILILRRLIDHAELPGMMSISSITLAELSAGPHHTNDSGERAQRLDILQRAEAEFDPLPFDTEAARVFGRVSAAILETGRTTRRRVADLMIASIAAANGLPLYTTNPDDFSDLKILLRVEPVTRPSTAASK